MSLYSRELGARLACNSLVFYRSLVFGFSVAKVVKAIGQVTQQPEALDELRCPNTEVRLITSALLPLRIRVPLARPALHGPTTPVTAVAEPVAHNPKIKL